MKRIYFLLIFLVSIIAINSQTKVDYDSVKAQKFDNGKMWTFDYPPTLYFEETYDFSPDEEWLKDVRLSALRIPGCSSSFVSEDGLIMTNHHCSEGHRNKVQQEGEDLSKTGFYAASFEEERQVPGLYAEQLVLIKDVTDEVQEKVREGKTDEEKLANKKSIIEELQNKYSEESGLSCRVVEYYNGGKYSLHGMKRYDDVRLVFMPEEKIGYFGGDFDNFTYPRYNLDCAFFRVYEDGKPIKTENYYKFSENGAQLDEPIFVVGFPGRTSRLKTVAQLKFNRDFSYRNAAFLYDEYYNRLEALKKVNPTNAERYEDIKVAIGNGQKVITNVYKGLQDDYMLARKSAFENELKSKVFADKDLNDKYSEIWDKLEELQKELSEYYPTQAAFSISRRWSSEYFKIADEVIEYAAEIQKSETDRSEKYNSTNIDSLKQSFFPENFDKFLQDMKLAYNIEFMRLNLGDDELLNKVFGNDDIDKILASSYLTSKEKTNELLSKSPDEILNSDDPFIQFAQLKKERLEKANKMVDEIRDTEEVFTNMLGEALFSIYGTNIPPDANRSLRINDGMLNGFDYNGTVAPEFTTFYGLYDRYYSKDGAYPWGLHERWLENESDLDKSVKFNFVSTNDIIGGNSGSAVINKNAEVVGLAFDGNMDSIIGNFIYLPHNNRMVAVTSQGMIEAIQKIYKANKLAEELRSGKIK